MNDNESEAQGAADAHKPQVGDGSGSQEDVEREPHADGAQAPSAAAGDGEAPEPGRTSQARIDANRLNAAKSTGPRTAAGKARSSQNAVKHGGYARAGAPIVHGPFAECPDEMAAFLSGIIADLAPRDSLEWSRATRIGQLQWSERRLDRMEEVLLNSAAELSQSEVDAIGGDVHHADILMTGFAQILDRFRRRSLGQPVPTTKGLDADYGFLCPFEALAHYARIDRDYLHIRDVWDEHVEPATEEGWERAFWTIMDHRFATVSQVEAWVEDQSSKVARKDVGVQREAGRIIAQRSLQAYDEVLALRARTTRELVINLAIYQTLKSRKNV